MIIYLIRHGRQNSSDCNVNVPLSKEGQMQAELLGKRMKRYPVDALYTSDLIRAVETGQIAFSDRPDLISDIQIRKGLAEVDFGDLTGEKDPVVKEYYKEYYQKQLSLSKIKRIVRQFCFSKGKYLCRRVLCANTGNALSEW